MDTAGGLPWVPGKQATVEAARCERFALPLAKPLTTASGKAAFREGVLLHAKISGPLGTGLGVGEASPLPGAWPSCHCPLVKPAGA